MASTDIASGLAKIRRRRWALWTVFLTYIPAIWVTLRITESDWYAGAVLVVWVIMAAVAGGFAAFARCPWCGDYYHIKGLTPVWVRKCLHCGLPLNADRLEAPPS